MSKRLSERIGIYGGTFDPVHNGHIEIARRVARNFDLDKLLIVPTSRPPHKDHGSISDAYHRYAMAVLATIGDPRLFVSTVELEAPDRPYTYQTVERLRELYGDGQEYFFIMGADSFAELDTWREPERLIASVNIVVAARPGVEISLSHLPEKVGAEIVDLRGRDAKPPAAAEGGIERPKIFLTDYVEADISSTEIRRAVGEGRSVKDKVPPPVFDYIEKYELYRR
ncbi:MAG TPA: nicotinate-nucleotide adenylyltransferase [Blastocatellia bacterium]|nr:nicotinate-nucleotide adenylyltransferase [Blastocatellia bacterium]